MFQLISFNEFIICNVCYFILLFVVLYFRECLRRKLALAGDVIQELKQHVDRTTDADHCLKLQLCDSLRALFSETGTYDYEQLRFILANLARLSDQTFDRVNVYFSVAYTACIPFISRHYFEFFCLKLCHISSSQPLVCVLLIRINCGIKERPITEM